MKITFKLKINKKIKKIKIIVFDVDGVLTDQGLWYSQNGEIIKRFNVKDGLGIKILQRYGYEIAFLSGGKKGATESRAKDLNIKYCLSEIKDKFTALKKLIEENNFQSDQVLYVGDDLNDLPVRKIVGIFISTADANPYLKKHSDIVLSTKGGHGIVRELLEKYLLPRKFIKELARDGWKEINF